ncbi:hypothetical protein Cs7R123_61440 [Catellatospora sp. TT07R-123]|uniref:hypothetical protein n=1 Tax=Catellatospora sp. TT07R-123 TaxID=2733863 RepID=UPI001B0137BE|nr:hypothetical protein [Catellatospora sp. TT07R-123]GHJ48802.1 hypothetical protein Cs7R123_61440 [Catellatospora sp. TT07R-123]
MTLELDDERLADLIRRAHRDTHLAVPLSRITRGRPARRPLPLVLAAAALVAVVLLSTWWLTGGGGPHAQPALPSAAPTPTSGKPPRPSSDAVDPLGRCADYAAADLAADGRDALPPLRFQLEVVPGELTLLLYAEDRWGAACWLTPQQGYVDVNGSSLTTEMNPSYPPGRLSNSSAAYATDPRAAYTFGRVPTGTTRVEVHFPGGPKVVAQLRDGWYVYAATGADADRIAEITKIVVSTADGQQTLPIEHG